MVMMAVHRLRERQTHSRARVARRPLLVITIRAIWRIFLIFQPKLRFLRMKKRTTRYQLCCAVLLLLYFQL